jgi:hypothetical protein
MADQMTQQQQLLPNVSIFVDNEASDALRCQLCERVAKNPYNTSCLHRFCKHCTDGVAKGKGCPLIDCKEYRNKQILTQMNFNAMSQLRLLMVKCPRSTEYQCTKQSTWEDMMQHYNNECDFRSVPCRNMQYGCQKMVIHHLMDQHVKSECTHQPLLCSYCHVTIMGDEDILRFHQIEDGCPDYSIECVYKCSIPPMARKHMLKHHTTCTKKPIKCAICIQSIPSDMQEEHNITEAQNHINILFQQLTVLRAAATTTAERFGRVDVAQSSLSERLNGLEDCNNITCKNIDKLQKTTKVLNDTVVLQVYSTTSGFFKWRLKDFMTTINGYNTMVSVPFYTNLYGYKLILRIERTMTPSVLA